MKRKYRHDKMTIAMLRMRENLLNAHVLQASTMDEDAREGTILFFDEGQQLYAVLWQEATASQDLLEFVSLEVLLVHLVDMGMKGIVRTLIQFEENGVSGASIATTSNAQEPENCTLSPVAHSSATKTPTPAKKRVKIKPTPPSVQPSGQKRLPAASARIDQDTVVKKSRKAPKMATLLAVPLVEDRCNKNTANAKSTANAKNTANAKSTANAKNSANTKSTANAKGTANTKSTANAKSTGNGKRTGNGTSARSLARYAKALQSAAVTSTPRHASSILNPCNTPQPTCTEQQDNHTLQYSLVPGAMRVMPRYSVAHDPYPLAAYNGLSPGGLFEFHVGPNQSAFLTRADVSMCLLCVDPRSVCNIVLIFG